MPVELLVILSALGLGTLIFLAAGIFQVKADTKAIFEKLGDFHALHSKGIYFYFPIAYQKVATYSTKEQVATLKFNGETIQIKYVLSDIVKYHYSGHDIENTLATALKKNQGVMLTARQFIESLNEIGVTLIPS